MILLALAIYGLFCLAYVARPGRRAGAWLLAATILLPFALIGAGLVDGNRAADRMILNMRESTFIGLPMGAAESNVGDSLGKRVEVSRSRIGDVETVGYVYDGRYTLIFQNGKLVSKSRR
jgi:hypothetical protein